MWRPGPTSLLLLSLSLLAATTAHAVVLSGSTRWSGNVSLAEEVTVPHGATLTIVAGTRVSAVSAGARIRVTGKLLVEGTAGAPVVFATPVGWQGILFTDGEGGSRIIHARFSRAAAAISTSATDFTVGGSEFQGCDFAIKLEREARPLIENCWFADNGIGIANEMKSSPTIRNNRFSGQTKAAIMASHASRGPITGNRFVENQQGIVLIQRYDDRLSGNVFSANDTAIFCNQTQKTPQITMNHFQENRVAIANTSFAQPEIAGNHFIGNDTAIHNDQYGSARIENNLFRDNGTALYNNRKSSPKIRLNRFEENRLALFCDYASYPEVKQNNFLGNAMAVKLGLYQSIDWERRYGAKPQSQREAAMSKGKGSHLPGVVEEAAPILDISSNWWGKDTAALAAVGERGNLAMIYDGYDLPEVTYEGYGSESYRLDRVRYAPWLAEAVAAAGVRERP